MRFTVALALFAAPFAAFAQTTSTENAPIIPNGNYNGTAGQPFTFKWTPSTTGTVSLFLREGASSQLTNGVEVATDIPNSGSYTFTIPANTVRNSDYAIEIRSSTGLSNYTPHFVIESTVTVYSTTASSASGSATGTSTGSSASSASASKTSSALSALSSASSSGSSASSASSSASSKSSASASSKTTATSAASAGTDSSSSTSAGSTGSAPRATAAAGMMGLIALGALAL